MWGLLLDIASTRVTTPHSEPSWHRNARRRRSEARALLHSLPSGGSIAARAVRTARQRLERHHGSAMPQFAADTGRHSPKAWICNHCSIATGKEVVNRPARTECFRRECGRKRPKNAKLFGSRPRPEGGENERKRPRGKGGGDDGGETQGAASIARSKWESAKSNFGEDHCITKAAYSNWQAAIATSPNSSKVVRELQAKLKCAQDFAGTPETDAEIKKLEAQIEVEKAKTSSPKSASDELRAAEGKRKQAAKKVQQAEDEIEAAVEAEREVQARKAKAWAAKADAQRALDEADCEVTAKKKAVARSEQCVVFADTQVTALATQFATVSTVVAGARAAAQNPELKAKLAPMPELETILNSLIDSVSQLASAFPPEMRKVPTVDLEHENSDEAEGGAWSVAGANGRAIRTNPPPGSDMADIFSVSQSMAEAMHQG